jgi:hypothetical protein
MPRADDPRGAARPRKRKQPPVVRPTQGHGPPPPPKPTLGTIPSLERAPGQRQAAQAGRKAQQARPATPAPQIPILANPTRKQVAAAHEAVTRTVRAHAKATGKPATQAIRDLRSDPRAADFVKAADYYAKVGHQQNVQALGEALGGRTRAERERLGRKYFSYQGKRDTVHQGRGDRKVAALGVSVTPAQIGRTLKGATSLGTGDIGPREAFGKTAKDVASLGTFPITVGYETGAGVADVARGKGTGRLQREAKGFAESLKEQVTHPLKYAGEHPGLAALTLAGGVGAAGRVGGALARGAGSRVTEGGMRGSLARAGSTERSPLALGDDVHAPIVERRGSKDITRAAVQRSNDARREPLTDKQGNVVTRRMPSGQVLPVLKARTTDIPGIGSERTRLLKGEANFRAARANAEERSQRDRVNHEFKVKGIHGPARDLVSMVVEGTISSAEHFKADLVRHADRIDVQLRRERANPGSVFRHPAEIRSAEHRLRTVQKALGSQKILDEAPRIVAAGEDIGRRLNTMEAEAIRLGILNPKRAARSRLIVPAVEHMDARHFSAEELRAEAGIAKKDLPAEITASASEKGLYHGAMRQADGRFLSNADIEEALRAKGRDPASVAYLPHRHDVRGRRAFHTQFRPGGRPLIDKPGTRTGSLYARGATSASPDLIREQAARLVTQTVKTGHYDRLIGDLGLKHPTGRHYTGKEAQEFADRLAETTGEQLIPVRAFPGKLSKEAKGIARREQGTQAAQTLHEAVLNKRLDVGPGTKNVVLMPKPVVDQLLKHLRPAGSVEKFFQAINPAFRLAVLPQFRWLTGNIVEPYLIRLPVEGSGVINLPGMAMDLRATSKILKTMRESSDPRTVRMAEMLDAQQLGSGLFIGGRGASVRRDLREFGKAGAAAAFFRDLPVMKQAADLFLMIPHSFFALNRIIETGAQRTAFGRLARRELQSFTGSWTQTVLLQRASMQELAKGLTDTPTQRRFMSEQHKMLGQYEGFPPGLRRMVQSVTPFVPWYLNALRFAYWTMPVHHTTLTALAAITDQAYEKDFQAMHRDVPPGSLKFAIPNGKGGWVDLARYTPYGAGTDVLGGHASWQTAISQIAPQLQGVMAALTGQDPFGRPLQVPKDPQHPQGKPVNAAELLPIAANQLAGSMIPFLSTVQRLREGGGTPYANSNVISPKTKPGTKDIGAVNRTFNPIRPTYLRQPTAPAAAEPTAAAPAADRFTQLRRQAAQRRQATQGSSDRLLELRRAAAARRPR